MRLIDGDELLTAFPVDDEPMLTKSCVRMTIQHMPTNEPQRKKGEWTEKTVIENPQAAGIDEWQSCKCSNCGRYDTRPYKYYFNEPRYCSWCGADMKQTGTYQSEPEIIRCKDCVWWDDTPSGRVSDTHNKCINYPFRVIRNPFQVATKAEDFCSCAKRKAKR